MKNPQILGRVLQEISFAHWGVDSALYQRLPERRGYYLLADVLCGVAIIEEGTTIVPRLLAIISFVLFKNIGIQYIMIFQIERTGYSQCPP